MFLHQSLSSNLFSYYPPTNFNRIPLSPSIVPLHPSPPPPPPKPTNPPHASHPSTLNLPFLFHTIYPFHFPSPVPNRSPRTGRAVEQYEKHHFLTFERDVGGKGRNDVRGPRWGGTRWEGLVLPFVHTNPNPTHPIPRPSPVVSPLPLSPPHLHPQTPVPTSILTLLLLSTS